MLGESKLFLGNIFTWLYGVSQDLFLALRFVVYLFKAPIIVTYVNEFSITNSCRIRLARGIKASIYIYIYIRSFRIKFGQVEICI